MSFKIVKLLNRDSDAASAVVAHGSHEFDVVLKGLRDNWNYNGDISAELGWDEVRSWKFAPGFQDADSGIWRDDDGIHLFGKVHQTIGVESGEAIVDVYMQNYADFFAVNSSEIGGQIPDVGNGLEIVVLSLYIYPSHI
jgi:hypothetical protein